MASLGAAVVREYQRGVVFRLGKVRNVRDPGLRFMIPLVDRMQKVSLRTVTMPIQSQQVIPKDNVSMGVAAVANFRRVDPVKSIVEIENVQSAINEIAQTTVRNVAEAVDGIVDHPIALQLRNLQVLAEIAIERKPTIIFPTQFLDSIRSVAQFVDGEAPRARL